MSRFKTFKRIATAIGLALAVVAAGVVVVRGSSELLKQSIRLNFPLVFLSLLVECSGLLIAIPVWRRILASYGVRRSARDDLRIFCYSGLGVVLPGGIWPIVGRATLYERLGVDGLRVTVASVVETFVVGVAAMGVYMVATVIRPDISLWRRPEIGVGFAALTLLLIHPRIFAWVGGWLLQRSRHVQQSLVGDFNYGKLAAWAGLEAVVTIIGGLAVFTLLVSLTPVSLSLLVPVLAAWAAAGAVSNLFFWLPGTPLLRDGAMVLALTPGLPLPVALVFVILVRVWSIASLLIVAGLLWLVLDWPVKKRV